MGKEETATNGCNDKETDDFAKVFDSREHIQTNCVKKEKEDSAALGVVLMINTRI